MDVNRTRGLATDGCLSMDEVDEMSMYSLMEGIGKRACSYEIVIEKESMSVPSESSGTRYDSLRVGASSFPVQ